MTDWLLETLVWTAALIALVLLVRRPVARWLGPQFAYALWALPALRLILPPIELPAWLAPSQTAQAPVSQSTFLILDPAAPTATHDANVGDIAGSGAAAPDTAIPFTLQAWFDALPVLEIGLTVWLVGAAIFLWLRFANYFRLRGELLENAREVGRADGRFGKIRLLETPGTKAPLAFGVIDPVIAMPPDFMAHPDRNARDLALAHELAHHHGHDLLINIMVQPLFALHWFTPLSKYGWLALRRDQEAACDARVVAAKPAPERAAYASLIASFAAGPNLALAAPMACPVLGDKSIVHRLRSLTMSNPSPRRAMTGRLMLGAAVIALPLTASISYAETTAPEPPAAPAAPQVGAVAPAPPAPPAPPVPPTAPAPLLTETITAVDPDTGEERTESVIIIQDVDEEGTRGPERRVERVEIIDRRPQLSDEERQEILEEVRESLAESREVLEDLPDVIEDALESVEDVHNRRFVVRSGPVVKMECRNNSEEVAVVEDEDGEVRRVFICQSRIMAHALKGLKEARNSIANNPDFPGEMRKEILNSLDEQIKAWEDANT